MCPAALAAREPRLLLSLIPKPAAACANACALLSIVALFRVPQISMPPRASMALAAPRVWRAQQQQQQVLIVIVMLIVEYLVH